MEKKDNNEIINEIQDQKIVDDPKKIEKILSVSARVSPESVLLWEQYKGKYASSKDAMDSLIKAGYEALKTRVEGISTMVTPEMHEFGDLSERLNQMFSDMARRLETQRHLYEQRLEQQKNELTIIINETRERVDVAEKAKVVAEKTCVDHFKNLEQLSKRNKELELIVDNSNFSINSLRKINNEFQLKIETVDSLEKALAENRKAKQQLSLELKESSMKVELLGSRVSEQGVELNKLREAHLDELREMQKINKAEIREMRGEHKSEIEELRLGNERSIQKLQEQAIVDQRNLREELQAIHERVQADTKAETKEVIKRMQAEYGQTISDLRNDINERVQAAVVQSEQLCDARLQAEVTRATVELKGEKEDLLQTIKRLTAEVDAKKVKE